ncbi:MAG: mandelate racemase/muconate lactonizing enzyme family protein [Ktedonobacteraceae bacterium]|nr:mandelate racemase/muconate lactonizing enzyme family protein [Ktedonobacteraceae bacterium]
MKIIDVRTTVVGNPWKNWIFIQLFTDEGIVGVGEATGGLSTKPNEAAVHELRPLFLGQDPRDIVALWERLHKGLFLNHNAAMAGIEMACWDILGKSLGVPVWRLLGGQTRPRIRAYANGWYQVSREPRYFAERAAEVVAMGYTALKFDPFGDAYRFMSHDELRFSMEIVGAVREAIGESVDLLIEGHDRFSVSTAIEVGHALAEFRPFWFETPVMSTEIEAMAEVARALPLRVVGGERFASKADFMRLLSTRTIDVVQPEILRCGGVMGLTKVAALAEAYEAFVAPHNAQSPFTTVVNSHVGATLSNLLIQECFDDFLVPWSNEIMSGSVRIVNGYIELPDGPGFGVTLNEKEMAKYPYAEKHFLRLFQSGWERREGSTA